MVSGWSDAVIGNYAVGYLIIQYNVAELCRYNS